MPENIHDFDHVTPQELFDKIMSGEELVILDVRDELEIERLPFPSRDFLVHIPLDRLEMSLDRIDENQHIIVLCHFGGRSMRACSILIKHGYKNVYNLQGGMNRWYREVGSSLREAV